MMYLNSAITRASGRQTISILFLLKILHRPSRRDTTILAADNLCKFICFRCQSLLGERVDQSVESIKCIPELHSQVTWNFLVVCVCVHARNTKHPNKTLWTRVYLHRSFGNCHIEINEYWIWLRFASVLFECVSHRHSILLTTPHCPAIVYRRYVCFTSPDEWKKKKRTK